MNKSFKSSLMKIYCGLILTLCGVGLDSANTCSCKQLGWAATAVSVIGLILILSSLKAASEKSEKYLRVKTFAVLGILIQLVKCALVTFVEKAAAVTPFVAAILGVLILVMIVKPVLEANAAVATRAKNYDLPKKAKQAWICFFFAAILFLIALVVSFVLKNVYILAVGALVVIAAVIVLGNIRKTAGVVTEENA